MELRQYLSIIPRRWPIVAGATLVALVAAIVLGLRGPRAYEATVRLAVSLGADAGSRAAATAGQSSVPPAIGAPVDRSSGPSGGPGSAELLYPGFNDYYYWLSAEYLADDLSEIVRSDAFVKDVGTYLDVDVRRVLVKDVIRTRKTHRILEVTVQAPEPDQAVKIAQGINQVMIDHGSKYLAQLATPSGQISVLDNPVARPSSTTGSQALDIAIRTLAGFVVGVFFAVVAEYFDSTIRTAHDVERILGLPTLGQIPEAAR